MIIKKSDLILKRNGQYGDLITEIKIQKEKDKIINLINNVYCIDYQGKRIENYKVDLHKLLVNAKEIIKFDVFLKIIFQNGNVAHMYY